MLGPTAGPRKQSFPRLYGKLVICNTMMPWEFERLALENGWEKVDELTVFKKRCAKIADRALVRPIAASPFIHARFYAGEKMTRKFQKAANPFLGVDSLFFVFFI